MKKSTVMPNFVWRNRPKSYIESRNLIFFIISNGLKDGVKKELEFINGTKFEMFRKESKLLEFYSKNGITLKNLDY